MPMGSTERATDCFNVVINTKNIIKIEKKSLVFNVDTVNFIVVRCAVNESAVNESTRTAIWAAGYCFELPLFTTYQVGPECEQHEFRIFTGLR